MTLNVGSDKIKDIYVGSQSIGAIYNGSQLVWQHDSYPQGTVLLNSGGQDTNINVTGTITLKKGVYYIDLTGGGGGVYLNLYYVCYAGGGSSGGTCAGLFYNPTEQTFSYTIGGRADNVSGGGASSGKTSLFKLGSTTLLTAEGGANGRSSGGGAGTATVSISAGITNISVTGITGNAGINADNGTATGASSNSTINTNWGHGNTGYSGCRVEGDIRSGGIYIRYERLNP